jgi:signal transduction histidine kinase
MFGFNSVLTMFAWSMLGIFDVLFFFLALYFVYVFIDKKDINLSKKIILIILFLPIIIFASTQFNLTGFDAVNCNATENTYYVNYTFFLEILFSFWIIILTVHRYISSDKIFRKQITSLSIGITIFLLSFFSSGFIADRLSEIEPAWGFKLEQYGLFGMVVFMAFLAYLIVRYKAFNIKLLGAQALVAALLIGIGSQFFFIQNPTNRILNAVTFCISLGFGYFLVKSVKLEVQRKEELQELYKQEARRKAEIQKMADQLSSANDKLHQLDKAKSEFISIASHQLRTPPTSIKGFGSLILEGTYGEISPAVRNAVEKMYISNERQLHLVEDLLNISRIESGRMEFVFKPEQIEDIVDEIVSTLELAAKNAKLFLHWERPALPLPKVKIDITKVKEVISNMVDNAVKYTQKGGITVKVELTPSSLLPLGNEEKAANESPSPLQGEDRGGVVRVVVSDTGIGMNEEELENIFEKFRRGKDVSRHNTEGTGLGMYIGKKIADAHKGRIWAESQGKGKGSKFILELPAN